MSDNTLTSLLQISETNSQLLSYLSEISKADKKLLYQTIEQKRPNTKNYEDSWGYVIQATRHGGFKWYDSHTGSLIFFGRKSESDSTLVAPAVFAEPEYLAYVIARLQKDLTIPRIIIKNVNLEDAPALTSYGFRYYHDGEGWCSEARFDDQTFPQLIVDLKGLYEMRGGRYKNLRTVLKKKHNFRIRKYRESDQDAILDIFALRDGNPKGSLIRSKGAYFVSHIMYLSASVTKFVIIDQETNEILGFTATSRVSSITTALIAALFNPRAKHASVWGIYQTLANCYQEGYQLVNLGGCELKGSHNFMRWTFSPVEQLGKTHVVYGK